MDAIKDMLDAGWGERSKDDIIKCLTAELDDYEKTVAALRAAARTRVERLETEKMFGPPNCPSCTEYNRQFIALRASLALAERCVEVLKDTPSHIGPVADWWGRRIAALRDYEGKP